MEPASIRYVVGDATDPEVNGPTFIAHVCNDVGAWGAGFVLAVSARWREPERAFVEWYRGRDGNDFALGALQLVPVADELWVANLIGQRDIVAGADGRPPVRYDAIESALQALAGEAVGVDGSVHMPRIGCGLAGGSWDRIAPILERTLLAAGVPTTVYDLPNH